MLTDLKSDVLDSLGLSLDLRPLTLWDSRILLLYTYIRTYGLTLSRGSKCHVVEWAYEHNMGLGFWV